MNVEEFVRNILVSIDKAVDSARSEMKRDINFADTKDQRTVEFDIAVAVEEINQKSGKAGIKVLQFAEAGGDISKENKNSTVSRIKFGIHIDSMTKDEDKAHRASYENYSPTNQDPYALLGQ